MLKLLRRIESAPRGSGRKHPGWVQLIVAFTFVLGAGAAFAAPLSPTDETKVPHYFGPYPNWALSPLPTLDANGAVVPGTGIRKFVDSLPGLTPAGANNLGQYLPVAVADTTTYPGSDYYEIGLVQYRQKMHSDLPATLLRGYVQLSTAVVPGGQVALSNALLAGGNGPVLSYKGVTAPNYLGPVILARKDRPVRILFRNLLPTGAGGDLFLPVDSTMMGSGMGPTGAMGAMDQGTVTDMIRNPACSEYPKGADCFKDNRATLHLHGGITPWISDGTPHQWITPAGENTPWPKGVSVKNVPDMPDPGPGAMTFFYTNQQSARLMFYHDHAWGITRLNVYAGEAAGYLISDATEDKLIDAGAIPTDMIPLIVQDRTFVPPAPQLAQLDPTWNAARWGGHGNLWYHHVYMPAQNPGDAGGMSDFGRWMYGPWFWPPATPLYGPIANPYYDPNCLVDGVNVTFCEPEFIPGTPNISVGMEQFNDTPIVNGTAYPTLEVDAKPYRLRILNAANDRFFNFQWYVGDPNTASAGLNWKGQPVGPTEVALNAAELAAAQLDPVVFPTPDTAISPAGPAWLQIGTEGGFLPGPVVIPNQPTTWITDPTRFDVGNVDLHSLLLAPAERADVIVDFSNFAGKTLILYNDAPAAFPARVPSYDYYTGQPDLYPVGAPGVQPGYGPNTRTVMQVKVRGAGGVGTPNDVNAALKAKLDGAFAHQLDANNQPAGAFESGQPPIIVGQAAYNSAYGSTFPLSSWCNAPGSAKTLCDGYARILDQGGMLFGFNTLAAPTAKFTLPIQPKAIHDEMNSVAFDEFGRMTANLGVEAVPATPAAQNVTLYPYTNPATELIDATNLPKANLAGVNITPIATQDGTQLWKITHNGVDTHPIHFHLYDVQLVNRVTWDNIVIPPDPNELGWKDTVRISPLEDTIVALRPIIPILPFDLPNSIRPLNPMEGIGSTAGFNNVDPNGNPTNPIANDLVNFGWEYVYHCHILSHEEMDMMRPVSVAMPPKQADTLSYAISGSGASLRVVLSWKDNSLSETAFLIQKSINGGAWTDVGTIASPLNQTNTTGTRSLTDPGDYNPNNTVLYRVVAENTVGYGGEFPSLTVSSTSAPLTIAATPLSLVTTTLPSGTIGVSYYRALLATGGATPYTWTRTAGALPGGLTLTAAGAITGTPTTAGTFNFTVRVTDATGATASRALSMTVIQPLTVVTTTMPAGTNGTAYYKSLLATAGTQPYTWSLAGGALPAGLTLSAAGAVSGTPQAGGTFNFTVRVTDNVGATATRSLSLVINGSPLTVVTTTVPAGMVGTAYYRSLIASGGSAPYTWSLASGTLPRGLTFNSAGAVSGTPTRTGTFTFTVRVRDGANATATRSLSITVN